MTEKKPRVSIGLPVYNAERFLEQALDGILAQTYTNFELVICDNASTDGTQAICQRYAALDPRIKYHRNPQNIGVSRNFNRAFELSCGEYFRKWCCHDDIPAPTFLEKCVAVSDLTLRWCCVIPKVSLLMRKASNCATSPIPCT